jgi:ABC-2 type transport system ATP-binding protein
LKQQGDRWRVSLFGDRLHVITELDSATGIRETSEKLQANGVSVLNAHQSSFSLEDVFIAIVEKARLSGKVVTGE